MHNSSVYWLSLTLRPTPAEVTPSKLVNSLKCARRVFNRASCSDALLSSISHLLFAVGEALCLSRMKSGVVSTHRALALGWSGCAVLNSPRGISRPPNATQQHLPYAS